MHFPSFLHYFDRCSMIGYSYILLFFEEFLLSCVVTATVRTRVVTLATTVRLNDQSGNIPCFH